MIISSLYYEILSQSPNSELSSLIQNTNFKGSIKRVCRREAQNFDNDPTYLFSSITPIYMNTNKILDECAMRWDGYSDIQEISNCVTSNNTDETKSGFGLKPSMWNFGIHAGTDSGLIEGLTSTKQEKAQRTHTNSSLLLKLINSLSSSVDNKSEDVNTPFIGEICLVGDVVIQGVVLSNQFENEKSMIKFEQNGIFDSILLWFNSKLKSEYEKMNGIKNRSQVLIETPIGKGYCHLSAEYFYQFQLNDLFEIDMKCLCKVIDTRDDLIHYDIIALFV